MNTHNYTQMHTTPQIPDRVCLWRQSTPIESKLTFPGRIPEGHSNGYVVPDAIVTCSARECLLTATMCGCVV